jgi:hypothetical protein
MDDADLDDLEDLDDDDDDKAKDEANDKNGGQPIEMISKKELAKNGIEEMEANGCNQNGKNVVSNEKELEENKTAEDMDQN